MSAGHEQLVLGGGADHPRPPAAAEPAADRPEPTAEQRAAIANRDRDVFLEAGAGTGKTRVLVDRYCEAVATDGIEPERILAFTFTEKAAAEMRRRVREELAGRAERAEGAERIRLRAAARAGEAAPIATIHGYCRRLLAAHPAAAGLDPRFRVLDADEAIRIARASFDAALAELAGADDAVALTAAGYRNRLGSLIIAAHGELRNRGVTEAILPDVDPSAIDRREEPASPAEAAAITGGYAALRRLLAAFSARFELGKAERSAVDFDDLQLLALELLRDNPGILAGQRERFDHLLVDEFQDTSPIQVDLVRLLAGEETPTFTVGDAAQSIYGFRGADLESFRRIRAELTEGAGGGTTAMLSLTGSFRSNPDVLAAVNLIGSELLPDFTPLAVGRKPEPVPGPAGPAVELLLTDAKGWGDEEAGTVIATVATDAPPSRVAEARALARRLRELADEGVEPGSMVLLLRAFTHVDAYAEALELAGLDPYVVGGRGYWSSQQVTDALSLLGCVANPLDDEALLGALASPAAAVGPDALWMLRRIAGGRHLWQAVEELVAPAEAGTPAASAGSGDGDGASAADDPDEEARGEQDRWRAQLPAADRERLAAFHETLAGLRAGAAGLPLDELVERTLERFGYDLAALLMDDGLRRTANLLKLVRLAAEYERHDGRDLRGFLEQAADRATLSDREAEAAVAAEEHAGVRVMTVHAAKGLEFDCVAVADLGRRLAGGGHPPSLRIAFDGDDLAPRIGLRLARAGATTLDLAGYRELNDRAADADAEESGRLAYVAASRARRRLLLSGTIDRSRELEDDDAPLRRRSVLGVLAPALGVSGEDGQIVTAEPPSALPELAAGPFGPAAIAVRVTGAGSANADALSYDRRGRGERAAAGGGRPPMLALADRPAAAARTLSYGALADYERCGYRFLSERVLGLGGGDGIGVAGNGAGGGGLGFGRAVHGLLERSARDGWRPVAAEEAEAALRSEGFGEAEATRAAGLVAAWTDSPLLEELRSAQAVFRPEVPFRIGFGGETVIRGTIDLIAERPGGPPLFVDYKTDRIDAGADPELTAAYEIQRLLYAFAVAEATGADEVESAYCFLGAADRPIRRRHDREAIAAGRAAVEERVSRIRSGDFSPTPDPGPSLCHDCPARARLCPYPTELTMGRAE